MTTEDRLINVYGIFLTVPNLAHLLNRSVDGIRITIQGDSDLGNKLRAIKIKVNPHRQ